MSILLFGDANPMNQEDMSMIQVISTSAKDSKTTGPLQMVAQTKLPGDI